MINRMHTTQAYSIKLNQYIYIYRESGKATDAGCPHNEHVPFPSGLHANAETTVPSAGGDSVQTFCHCDNRCRTT